MLSIHLRARDNKLIPYNHSLVLVHTNNPHCYLAHSHLRDSLHVPASLPVRHGHTTSFWPVDWEQMWWAHLPGCTLKGRRMPPFSSSPFMVAGPLGPRVRRQSVRDEMQQKPGNLGFWHQRPMSEFPAFPCFTAHYLRNSFTASLGQKERPKNKNSIY